MKAGQLRNRVVIQTKTVAPNGLGELVETWADTTTVWSDVQPLTAKTRELFATGVAQEQSRVYAQIEIRYRSGLSVTDNRIKYGTRLFEIENILDPEEQRKRLLLLGYEVQL